MNLLTLILLVVFPLVSCSENEARTYDHVVSSANRNVRPVRDNRQPLNLTLSYHLTFFKELDEDEQVLKTAGWLQMSWIDEYLAWDPQDYGGVDNVKVRQSDLWIPDVMLFKGHYEQDEPNPLALVKSGGEVIVVIPTLFMVPCPLDYQNYPNDTATCKYIFGSWAYSVDEINLIETDLDTKFFTEGRFWKLATSSVEKHEVKYECCPKKYGDITYTVQFRRVKQSHESHQHSA